MGIGARGGGGGGVGGGGGGGGGYKYPPPERQHWGQAACVFPRSAVVSQGQVLQVLFICVSSYMYMCCSVLQCGALSHFICVSSYMYMCNFIHCIHVYVYLHTRVCMHTTYVYMHAYAACVFPWSVGVLQGQVLQVNYICIY